MNLKTNQIVWKKERKEEILKGDKNVLFQILQNSGGHRSLEISGQTQEP